MTQGFGFGVGAVYNDWLRFQTSGGGLHFEATSCFQEGLLQRPSRRSSKTLSVCVCVCLFVCVCLLTVCSVGFHLTLCRVRFALPFLQPLRDYYCAKSWWPFWLHGHVVLKRLEWAPRTKKPNIFLSYSCYIPRVPCLGSQRHSL